MALPTALLVERRQLCTKPCGLLPCSLACLPLASVTLRALRCYALRILLVLAGETPARGLPEAWAPEVVPKCSGCHVRSYSQPYVIHENWPECV